MTGSEGPRLRLTVRGSPDLVVELGPDAVTGEAAAATEGPSLHRPGPEVRAMPPTGVDRATGRRRYEVTVDGWVLEVSVESAARARLVELAAQAAQAGRPLGAAVVRAQIPGRVVRLWVAEGDTVEAGQRLLAIEAMKMENEVRAPHAGTVESIRVAIGGSVELRDELLTVR